MSKSLHYQELSPQMQKSIKNGWDSGTVTTVILTSGMGILVTEDYLNKEIYCVEFSTELDSGSTAVFMLQDTLQFVGLRYSD